ncbi:MAG: type II secretion system protein [Poseidonibacter sp.]
MKKGFSLLELIFAIVVIGIIASFAIPKYLDTRDSALVSTLKRDIATATTSIQSYHLVEGKIDNISDAVTLNPTNWTIEAKKMTYQEDSKDCAVLEVKEVDDTNKLVLTVTSTAGSICEKLEKEGIKTTTYDLY